MNINYFLDSKHGSYTDPILRTEKSESEHERDKNERVNIGKRSFSFPQLSMRGMKSNLLDHKNFPLETHK
ncbi:hypothetical protein A3K80_02800 [Candidatus Bathyarchaeota archaeon RBG_13_38_9]|nr:MAG: hypothetical protein A3K80_02800 [Candidatus Bathyarchaeota archaeon RBG_13_38_9]